MSVSAKLIDIEVLKYDQKQKYSFFCFLNQNSGGVQIHYGPPHSKKWGGPDPPDPPGFTPLNNCAMQ
jgi:hypothetical protein